MQVTNKVIPLSLLLVKPKTKTKMNNTYQVNVRIPSRRIRKHSSVKIFKTKSELGNKVLNCPIGASFAVADDGERTGVHGWANRFGMKFTVRNTPGDSYKRAFRLA